MLLNNYAVRNAGQTRQLGGNIDPTQNLTASRLNGFFSGDHVVVSVTDRFGFPAGYTDHYSWQLPPKDGGMSSAGSATGTSTIASTGIAGLFATADLNGTGAITSALGGLIVEMIANIAGSGALTASVIGQVNAVANIAGSGSLSAITSAIAGLTATLAGTATMTGNPTGTGTMGAIIYVNQSEATVKQIVDAVWNAIAAEYNVSGTMGNKLNGAGSAGDPWTTDITAYNTANTAGKILKDRLSKNQFLGLK